MCICYGYALPTPLTWGFIRNVYVLIRTLISYSCVWVGTTKSNWHFRFGPSTATFIVVIASSSLPSDNTLCNMIKDIPDRKVGSGDQMLSWAILPFLLLFFYLMDWRCLMVLWSCCCVYHLHNYMRHSVPSTSFDVELVRSGSNCIWTNLREYQSILAHRLCQNNCHQMFSVCFVKLFDLYYLTV